MWLNTRAKGCTSGVSEKNKNFLERNGVIMIWSVWDTPLHPTLLCPKGGLRFLFGIWALRVHQQPRGSLSVFLRSNQFAGSVENETQSHIGLIQWKQHPPPQFFGIVVQTTEMFQKKIVVQPTQTSSRENCCVGNTNQNWQSSCLSFNIVVQTTETKTNRVYAQVLILLCRQQKCFLWFWVLWFWVQYIFTHL